MARYTRNEIMELCKRLDTQANALLTIYPAFASDAKQATMLLRLTTQLADIKEVDTTTMMNVLMIQRH